VDKIKKDTEKLKSDGLVVDQKIARLLRLTKRNDHGNSFYHFLYKIVLLLVVLFFLTFTFFVLEDFRKRGLESDQARIDYPLCNNDSNRKLRSCDIYQKILNNHSFVYSIKIIIDQMIGTVPF
jgi:hypothetical protein